MIEHVLAFIGGWFLVSVAGGFLWTFLRKRNVVQFHASDSEPEPKPEPEQDRGAADGTWHSC